MSRRWVEFLLTKNPRLMSLIAGVSLWLLYFFYLGRNPLPIYSFIDSGILFTITGLGTALIIYSIKGRTSCKWASILIIVMTVIGYLISNTLPPNLPGFPLPYPLNYIPLSLYGSLPFTLAFWFIKKDIRWKLPLIIIIALLIFSYQWSVTVTSLRFEADPSDNPLRDEIYIKNGWNLCGELYIDSTKPGYHVVTWNKKFRGNESFACYLKVKIPEGSKPVLATFSLTLSIDRHNIPEGGEIVPFYHSSGLKFNLEDASSHPPELYKFYEGANTIGIRYLSGDLRSDVEVIDRVDIYFSYKPSQPLPEYYSTDVVTEVSIKFEINILWEV